MSQLGEAQIADQLIHPCGVIEVVLAETQGELDVLLDRQLLQQPQALRNDRELGPGQVSWSRAVLGPPPHEIARVGFLPSAQQVQKCRLATSRWSDEREELTGRDGETGPGQCMNLLRSSAVALRQVQHLQYGRRDAHGGVSLT